MEISGNKNENEKNPLNMVNFGHLIKIKILFVRVTLNFILSQNLAIFWAPATTFYQNMAISGKKKKKKHLSKYGEFDTFYSSKNPL
jgi:hypothetical protein